MQDPTKLTATEAARLIRDGRLRPMDLMEACLARIAEREPAVRAFAWFDADAARRGAAAARPGPLHGLPIGVKDVLDTADMPSEYGSPIWRGWRPRADAAAVAWARHAGAVVVGKTVTTEFATRKPGPTGNPHNLKHTPGGSSSGSAAGVADGFFPLAYGTQTAGSVIRPAAYCGVVGYKPSFGMINRFGMKLMSESLDTVGVMARSVADCALFAGAVAGRDLGDPDARPERAPRIGICRSPAWDKALAGNPGAAAARRLGVGARGRRGRGPGVVAGRGGDRGGASDRREQRERPGAGLGTGQRAGSDQRGAARAAGVRTVADRSRGGGGACRVRSAQRAFPACMEGLDALVTPSAPGQAPAGLEWTGDPAFNLIWTSLHVPCVTVPAGTGPDGLPLGIQIVTRIGEDRQALAWAQWVAAAIG